MVSNLDYDDPKGLETIENELHITDDQIKMEI